MVRRIIDVAWLDFITKSHIIKTIHIEPGASIQLRRVNENPLKFRMINLKNTEKIRDFFDWNVVTPPKSVNQGGWTVYEDIAATDLAILINDVFLGIELEESENTNAINLASRETNDKPSNYGVW